MYETSVTAGETAPLSPVTLIIYLVLVVLILAGMWKMFTKAEKPGWAAIIPIYSTIVLLEVVKRPVWWLVLLFIPFVNIVAAIIIMNDLSKAFGKGVGMTVLNIFLPFIGYPILGFGDAEYQYSEVAVQPVAQPAEPTQPFNPTPPSNPTL